MDADPHFVTDPLGNEILLSQELCATTTGEQLYDTADKVIEQPAYIIRIKIEEGQELYYFRSVGWQTTWMIMARCSTKNWEAMLCLTNPGTTYINQLLVKGQLIDSPNNFSGIARF